MTKVELVKGLSEEMKISKKEVEDFIRQIDTTMEFLAEQGYEKTKVGKYIVAEKKAVPEKSGIALGKPYTVKAHDILKIKETKALKDI